MSKYKEDFRSLTIKSNIGILFLALFLPFVTLFSRPIQLFDTFVVETSSRGITSSFGRFLLSFHSLTTTLEVLRQTTSMIFFDDFRVIQFSSFVLSKERTMKTSDKKDNIRVEGAVPSIEQGVPYVFRRFVYPSEREREKEMKLFRLCFKLFFLFQHLE